MKSTGNPHEFISKCTFSLIGGSEAEHTFLWRKGFARGFDSQSYRPKTCDIQNSTGVVIEQNCPVCVFIEK